MPAKKRNSDKGKRYTPEERQKIVAFIRDYNEKHKRGGQSAAAKKFGVTLLTVGNWMRAERVTGEESGTGGTLSKTLAAMSKLARVIEAKEKELEALKAEFQLLKEEL